MEPEVDKKTTEPKEAETYIIASEITDKLNLVGIIDSSTVSEPVFWCRWSIAKAT